MREKVFQLRICLVRYLARYGGLVSLSAAKSNKFFKAKMIRENLMLEKYMGAEDEEAIINDSRKAHY